MSGPTGLLVEDLTVRYGDTVAIDRLSVAVPPGSVVALLGPSGCGKSTLLRAVAGLERPATGRVGWDGADLAPVPVHRRGFGLLFQEGQLFPHRDVAGNVAYGPRTAGASRAEQAALVAELLELVGLPGYERRAVTTLSGGEQQRVALARALAPRPRLLLLDEPLSALDRGLRERLAGDLAAILAATGTTALYVTHDHDEALTVADRVGVMLAGRLRQLETPERLLRHPVDREVAGFLGYGAFVPAELVGLGAAGTGTTAALRAESLVVDPHGPLTGKVRAHRVTRGGSTLRVDVPGLGEVDARSPGAEDEPPGSTVSLRVEPAAVALLPEPV